MFEELNTNNSKNEQKKETSGRIADYEYSDKDKSGGSGVYINLTVHREVGKSFEGRNDKLDFFLGGAMRRREDIPSKTDNQYRELSNRQANQVYENLINNVDKSKGTNLAEFRASLNGLVEFLETVNSENSKEIVEKLKPILEEAKKKEQEARNIYWELYNTQHRGEPHPKGMFDQWVNLEKTYKDFDISSYRSNDVTGKGQSDKPLLG